MVRAPYDMQSRFYAVIFLPYSFKPLYGALADNLPIRGFVHGFGAAPTPARRSSHAAQPPVLLVPRHMLLWLGSQVRGPDVPPPPPLGGLAAAATL